MSVRRRAHSVAVSSLDACSRLLTACHTVSACRTLLTGSHTVTPCEQTAAQSCVLTVVLPLQSLRTVSTQSQHSLNIVLALSPTLNVSALLSRCEWALSPPVS